MSSPVSLAPAARSAIPMARPDIGPRERELVAQVLDTDVLALGPFAEAFGQGVAALVHRRHGLACSSGTAATGIRWPG